MAVALVMSFGIMSCASTDSVNEPYETSAASILSQDSTQNPNACLVRAEWLADTLGLTDEQVAALKAAQDSLRAIAQAEIEAADKDHDAIRAAIAKYRASMRAAVESILTPEQLALLQELRPPFPNKRDRGLHRGHFKYGREANDSMAMARLVEELGLTPEQVTQVEQLREKIRTEKPEDPRKAFYDGMKLILTEEQLAKFEELVKSQLDGGHGRKVRHHGKR